MKTFRMIGMALFAFLMCVNFISCSNNDIPNDNLKNVRINLTGEYIHVEDLPLGRNTGKKPYYAIKVEMYNPNISDYEMYACGIFDNEKSMNIKLDTKKKYNFAVALLYDYLNEYTFGNKSITNEFEYADPYPAREIHGGYSSPFTLKDNTNTNVALVDSYYGFLENYSPESACNIELKRVTVGLEIIVEGLTEGHLSLSYPVATKIEPTNSNASFDYITSCYMFNIYNKEIYEKAEIGITINYVNKDNQETRIIAESLVFNRGYKKRILIKLNKEENTETNKQLSFSIENKEIKDEENQVIYDVNI